MKEETKEAPVKAKAAGDEAQTDAKSKKKEKAKAYFDKKKDNRKD